ncbi:hypothetical protein [Paraburkholderia sediminicola]|uniref:hypothetical protein n=1 Tax=Paraburkholderia sediminicola TaxID=458836 RepID=UPI0038BB0D7D
MKLLLCVIDVGAKHGWHLVSWRPEAVPKNPASRADAEFYCLLSLKARESGAHIAKEPRRDNLTGCIDEAPWRRTLLTD